MENRYVASRFRQSWCSLAGVEIPSQLLPLSLETSEHMHEALKSLQSLIVQARHDA
jgi:hypothetical protein